MFDEWLTPAYGALAATVVLAVTVQTTMGFGAMLIMITIGAFIFTVPELTAVLVPLSVLQATVIVVRHPREVDWQTVGYRILPFVAVGMAISAGLTSARPEPWMKPALGVLVIGLALRELWALGRPGASATTRLAQGLGLVAAGMVQGVFATGGPLVVWSIGQDPSIGKSHFRTTLNALWMMANAILTCVFVARGQIDETSLVRGAGLILPAFLGIGLGELLHDRVDETRFRVAVWVVVGLAGFALLA